MIFEADRKHLLVGYKQTMKAIAQNRAQKVYIARDSEERIFSSLVTEATEKGCEIIYTDTMSELGKLSGIDKGASCAVVTGQA